jgi:hypothetical protein
VYTTFRKARLALGRGFPTWEAARDFAMRLRKQRFHDRDAIQVVNDLTREVCALPVDGDDCRETPVEPRASAVHGPAPTSRLNGGYSVYASFHRGRIPLARRVASIEEAVAIVERFRRDRFDRSQTLAIVDEATGEEMTPEELGASPVTPSRERLLELHALAEDVGAAFSASAARERWMPWVERAEHLRAAARTLLALSGDAPSRRRARSISGLRRRTMAGAA